jgi:drug/metabolite transporter (DMT)-like permease
VPYEPPTGTALAASVACLCFGASVVATRFVVGQTSPVVLACLRYAIASVCMIALFRAQAFPRMPGRDRLTIAALGVIFFGIFPWSFSASLTHLPSAQVALIVRQAVSAARRRAEAHHEARGVRHAPVRHVRVPGLNEHALAAQRKRR